MLLALSAEKLINVNLMMIIIVRTIRHVIILKAVMNAFAMIPFTRLMKAMVSYTAMISMNVSMTSTSALMKRPVPIR